jgi:hypothetical protein
MPPIGAARKIRSAAQTRPSSKQSSRASTTAALDGETGLLFGVEGRQAPSNPARRSASANDPPISPHPTMQICELSARMRSH